MIKFFLLLLVAVAPATGAVTTEDEAKRQEEIKVPWTAERVWFRQPGKSSKIIGDLTITDDVLEVSNRKKRVDYPLDAIRLISFGRMKPVGNNWVVLEIERAGVTSVMGIRDGHKMGYGTATREIFDKLKETLRARSRAQFAVPEGFRTFEELETIVTFAVPEAWQSYHRTLISAADGIWYGTVVFSAEEIEGLTLGVAHEEQVRPASLLRFESAEIPAFFVDRREALPGMSCEGLGNRIREELDAWTVESELLGADRAVFEDPSVVIEEMEIAGCRGIRVSGTSTVDGESRHVELRVASDGRNTVIVGGRGQTRQFVESLEKTVASLKFSAAL